MRVPEGRRRVSREEMVEWLHRRSTARGVAFRELTGDLPAGPASESLLLVLADLVRLDRLGMDHPARPLAAAMTVTAWSSLLHSSTAPGLEGAGPVVELALEMATEELIVLAGWLDGREGEGWRGWPVVAPAVTGDLSVGLHGPSGVQLEAMPLALLSELAMACSSGSPARYGTVLFEESDLTRRLWRWFLAECDAWVGAADPVEVVVDVSRPAGDGLVHTARLWALTGPPPRLAEGAMMVVAVPDLFDLTSSAAAARVQRVPQDPVDSRTLRTALRLMQDAEDGTALSRVTGAVGVAERLLVGR